MRSSVSAAHPSNARVPMDTRLSGSDTALSCAQFQNR